MNTQASIPTAQHTISKTCPECGGDRMLYNAGPAIVSYAQNSKFDPTRPFWTCICTACGNTTFYLREPEKPPTKKLSQPLSNQL